MQESPLTERASIREALKWDSAKRCVGWEVMWLSYGMTPMASDAELLDALARAQLQYTLGVKSLGLDGKLAELSGGERQRVEVRLDTLLDDATPASLVGASNSDSSKTGNPRRGYECS